MQTNLLDLGSKDGKRQCALYWTNLALLLINYPDLAQIWPFLLWIESESSTDSISRNVVLDASSFVIQCSVASTRTLPWKDGGLQSLACESPCCICSFSSTSCIANQDAVRDIAVSRLGARWSAPRLSASDRRLRNWSWTFLFSACPPRPCPHEDAELDEMSKGRSGARETALGPGATVEHLAIWEIFPSFVLLVLIPTVVVTTGSGLDC